MHTLTSRDGVTLSYRSFGAGPTTVILLHGWMMSGAVYNELIEALNVSALGDPRLGLTRERLDRLQATAPGTPILHPGPMNRGLEIAADAADAPTSLVLGQVSAGVAVRMAVLYHLLAGSGDTAAEVPV